jgi:excinuclease ABC subunit C
MPDLVVIDGGAGQVNAAFGVLAALSLDIPVIGLAKKNEEVFLPNNGEPLVIPRRSAALRLLQRVRDETHRFATSKNTRLRAKDAVASPFGSLPHVAGAREQKLVKAYATMDGLREALKQDGPDALCALLKVSPGQAAEIAEAAGKNPPP